MKLHHTLISAALLAMSLSVNAGEPARISPANLPVGLASLSETPGSACKPVGDGSFAEIVTTMASVLSLQDGNALLARYCEPCMKQRLSVAELR